MVKAVNAAMISACARSAGSIFRIKDTQSYPDLMAPTVRREVANVLACSTTAFMATQALKSDLVKSLVPKVVRKSLLVQGLATIGPAILSEAWSRKFTGFNMNELIAREISKAKAAEQVKIADETPEISPKPSSLMQLLSRAKFGDGYPVGFQARATERLASATTANPFSQGISAALQFNNNCRSNVV